jgi:LysR family glycine cleavage system transcriptional activator
MAHLGANAILTCRISPLYGLDMRHLPSLSALRAFEAVARRGSFTAAGQELGMSQAAVSYQIKRLETELGRTLFTRRNRRADLTEDGEHLGQVVSRAFDLIESGLCRGSGPAILRVTTTGSFANLWLASRVGSFRQAHPEIDLRISATVAVEDLEAKGFDLAIRQGDGNWPPLSSELLCAHRFMPMCSPALIASFAHPPPLSDLQNMPWIAPHEDWWQIWLADAGGEPSTASTHSGFHLNNQTEAMAAAIAGQGVAMLDLLFAQPEIATGRLVCPWPQASSDGGGYWLAYPRERRLDQRLIAFRRWLVAQINRQP